MWSIFGRRYSAFRIYLVAGEAEGGAPGQPSGNKRGCKIRVLLMINEEVFPAAYLQTVPRISNGVFGFAKAALVQLRLSLLEPHLTGGKISA